MVYSIAIFQPFELIELFPFSMASLRICSYDILLIKLWVKYDCLQLDIGFTKSKMSVGIKKKPFHNRQENAAVF